MLALLMRVTSRKRQATTLSGFNGFCRSDKDRRDASDGATWIWMQETGCRMQEEVWGIKDKSGRCREAAVKSKRQEARDKQPLFQASMVSVGHLWSPT